MRHSLIPTPYWILDSIERRIPSVLVTIFGIAICLPTSSSSTHELEDTSTLEEDAPLKEHPAFEDRSDLPLDREVAELAIDVDRCLKSWDELIGPREGRFARNPSPYSDCVDHIDGSTADDWNQIGGAGRSNDDNGRMSTGDFLDGNATFPYDYLTSRLEYEGYAMGGDGWRVRSFDGMDDGSLEGAPFQCMSKHLKLSPDGNMILSWLD
ncbi:hypothetical protein LTR95_009821 [Oleoguttula sp. CCFEE 5521]